MTNPSCTSTANQCLPNHKNIQPIKIKDKNFSREEFCQRGKEKRSFVSTPKKKYNPLSKQGDTKMLTLNGFAEGLKDVFPETILFRAVSRPDVDFVTDLA